MGALDLEGGGGLSRCQRAVSTAWDADNLGRVSLGHIPKEIHTFFSMFLHLALVFSVFTCSLLSAGCPRKVAMCIEVTWTGCNH